MEIVPRVTVGFVIKAAVHETRLGPRSFSLRHTDVELPAKRKVVVVVVRVSARLAEKARR